jgi:membrane-bound ClpP family serine protease
MIDPNIVYLALLASLWLVVTAIHMPGTGMLEVLAVIAVIGAVVLLASVPTQWGAAVIVVIGTLSALVIPFFGREYELVAIGGLLVAAVGALFLFNGMAVSPAIILLVTGAGLIFQRFGLVPSIEHQKAQPAMLDDQTMIGARGHVQRALSPVGTVYVRGESWTARASSGDTPLTEGMEIMVVERDGLTLMVEPVKQKRTEPSADETTS